MANNPVRPGTKTPKDQYQTSGNDSVNWNQEGKMATNFYSLDKLPGRSRDTSGDRMYGDAGLSMLKGKVK